MRYFNAKDIEPILNISGAIPPGWAAMQRGKLQGLKDFDGYSEMATSLLKWARDKERLKFPVFMPFNETDLGFPVGPVIEGNSLDFTVPERSIFTITTVKDE